MSFVFSKYEKLKAALDTQLEHSGSKREKLFHLHDFISHILSAGNNNLAEAYLLEYTELYFELISDFSPASVNPSFTESIIQQAQKVLTLNISDESKILYSSSVKKLETSFDKHKKLLTENYFPETAGRTFFPLIEEISISGENVKLGLLESVSVQIKKSENRTRFHIIPSERELEKNIKLQVETSWRLAVQYIKKHIRKAADHHSVIIAFDNKSGIVQGSSVGTALTLAFIKELLQFYNSPVLINIPEATAYTGGLGEDRNISPVSEHFIKIKTEAIFFSGIQTFAVPREDEFFAHQMLKELSKNYPARKLKIAAVDDFDDLLSRRNLVEIKKINPIVRGGKFALNHSLSIILIVILAAVVLISGLIDFDNNPQVIHYENQHLRVLNANGKVLWSEKVGNLDNSLLDGTMIKKQYAIIEDIDDDGVNEIILSNIVFGPLQDHPEYNGVLCYDNKKQLLWQHTVKDVVSTKDISFSTEYRMTIIGVFSENNTNILFVIARNQYFPCAVFGIDILTGEQAADVFWHSGHLIDGIIFMEEETKRRMLIMGGVNNGFEAAAVVMIELDKLVGQAPAPENYMLRDIPPAEINKYILIPQTDYSEYLNSRYNAVASGFIRFHSENELISVGISEYSQDGVNYPHIHYYFNTDLSINFVEMGDSFLHERDKLVKEGKLSLPLTYTAEYFDILKNNIKYWDGEKFVSRPVQ